MTQPDPTRPETQALDGNVLAGQLSEVFAVDLTAMRGRCAGCGVIAVLATTVVHVGPQGTVARCSGCGAVLITIVPAEGRSWLSLSGISAIAIPAGDL